MPIARVEAVNLNTSNCRMPLHEGSPDIFDQFGLESKEKYSRYVESYHPWKQVIFKKIPTANGVVLEIADTFRPPSQTGQAPKLNGHKVPYGYVPRELDARVPYSAFFDPAPSSGHLEAAYFNKAGYAGTYWADSPNPKVDAEWRKRMGVESTSSPWTSPFITMQNSVHLRFDGVAYDSGISRCYGGNFDHRDMAEVAYATVLTAHHLAEIPTQPGDYFFVKAGAGKRSNYFFAIREEESNGHNRLFSVLTSSQDIVPLLQEVMEPADKKVLSAIPVEHWSYGEGFNVLNFVKRAQFIDKEKILAEIPKTPSELEKVAEKNQGRISALKKILEGDETDYYRLLFSLSRFVQSQEMKHLQDIVDVSIADNAKISSQADEAAAALSAVHVSFADSDDSINYNLK